MRWVSAAMPSKPIVALEPLNEWAMRKIPSRTPSSSGCSSIFTSARFSSCRCSEASARNSGRYSERSTGYASVFW